MKRIATGVVVGLLTAAAGVPAAENATPASLGCSADSRCQTTFRVGQRLVQKPLAVRGNIESYLWINRSAPMCESVGRVAFRCYGSGTVVKVSDGKVSALHLGPIPAKVTLRYWKP